MGKENCSTEWRMQPIRYGTGLNIVAETKNGNIVQGLGNRFMRIPNHNGSSPEIITGGMLEVQDLVNRDRGEMRTTVVVYQAPPFHRRVGNKLAQLRSKFKLIFSS
jgi:hypothetical protein